MSEPEDVPKITEVTPEEFPEIMEQLRQLGFDVNKDTYYPFELSIKLTNNRQIDISAKWDGDGENIRDIATILDSLTNGHLDQQIILALKLLTNGNTEILEKVKRLVRRWIRLRDERDDNPYIDSFQPLAQPQRGR